MSEEHRVEPETAPPASGETVAPPDTDAGQSQEQAAGATGAALAERLEAAQRELAEWRERCLRAHAELDNLRKRLEREAEQARRFANEAIIADLLPVLDSLERGLAADTVDAAALREGMELTLRQLVKVLEAHGVRILDPQGLPFDPSFHQAVATKPGEAGEADRVLAVVQKGLLLRERLVRPALVVVAAGAGESS